MPFINAQSLMALRAMAITQRRWKKNKGVVHDRKNNGRGSIFD
jgi:hypothetical protein